MGFRLFMHAFAALVAAPMAVLALLTVDCLRQDSVDKFVGVAWCFGSCYALPVTGLVGLFFLLGAKQPVKGHCTNCDYNLTGNTSGICPECGTPISPAPRHP